MNSEQCSAVAKYYSTQRCVRRKLRARVRFIRLLYFRTSSFEVSKLGEIFFAVNEYNLAEWILPCLIWRNGFRGKLLGGILNKTLSNIKYKFNKFCPLTRTYYNCLEKNSSLSGFVLIRGNAKSTEFNKSLIVKRSSVGPKPTTNI